MCARSFSYTVSFTIGSAAITLSPLAVASIAGIVLNAVFPGKDYKFDTEDVADAVNFEKEVKPKERNRRSNFTLIVVQKTAVFLRLFFYALFKAMYSKLNSATEWHKKQGTRTSTLYMFNY